MLAKEAEVRDRILRQFQEMSQEDQKLFLAAIWKQYGVGLNMTAEGLSTLSLNELQTLDSMLSGIRLTRENAPDVVEAYHRLKNRPLPSKTSFGKMPDPF